MAFLFNISKLSIPVYGATNQSLVLTLMNKREESHTVLFDWDIMISV